MKIALNGQYILINNPAGPERFTINLYKHLARVDHINEYTVYFEQEPTTEFINEVFNGNKNFKYKVIRAKFLWTQLFLALETWTQGYDVFFSARHTFPLLKNIKTKAAIMFHGLEYKTNDEFGKVSITRAWHPKFIKLLAALADLVIVPSQATKDNLQREFPNVDTSKIKIIHEGVDDNFHARTQNEVQPTLLKYGIDYKKYLLFISTIQPRKNLPMLIEAFAKSIKSNQDLAGLKLIVIGKLGWKYTDALEAPKKFGVEDNIIFLNWVPQSDIYDIISGALGYANFSVDEGFGLTVLEAMASEIPVAVSAIPAHKEVGQNTITYADANNAEAAAKILTPILEGNYDHDLIGKAKAQANTFTWESTANKLVKEFLNLKPH